MCNADWRIVCDPSDQVDRGEHKHLCKCGTCWKHSQASIDCIDDKDQHKLAHTCPNCGEDVRKRHYGPEDKKPDEDILRNLPTFAVGDVIVKYKDGFEVKTRRFHVVTEEAAVKDKPWFARKIRYMLDESNIDVDNVIETSFEGMLVPPPADMQEAFLNDNGLIATEVN